MIERFFAVSGHLSVALMGIGVAALWRAPTSRWAAAVVYAALLVLMLTPVTRVVVACIRYLRAGEIGSALLTIGILLVIAISGWAAW
jgi:uncharacterized membrane protein